jgi:Tfp pilus assembly PilM family ATPase/Tfp pilus assembly protein PilN
MSNPIIGIEYSREAIKIVEVVYGRRLKILNFAVVENAAVPAERRAEQLQHMLRTRGFEAKQAVVAFSGPGVEHRLLTLPPLSGREMQFVMAREARKLTGSGESLWSYDIASAKEEIGIKKSQILLVTSGPESVRAIQDALAGAKLKIIQVTTITESLLNLLNNTGGWKKGAVKCVIHFSGNLVSMMFVRDHTVLVSRDIPFDYGALSQDEQVTRLVTEIKRSILFFRQSSAQGVFDEFLFSGDSKLLGALAASAREEFGIEAGMLRFEESIDTSGLRGDWDTLRFNLPALSVALGAAWRKNPGAGINLLHNSRPSASNAPNLGRLAKFAIPASVVLVLLSGSYYFAEKSRLDTKEAEIRRRSVSVQQYLDQVSQEQARQQIIASRTAFIKEVSNSRDWSEILRGLSFAVPDSAVFDAIRIEQTAKPAFVIQGSISAQSLPEAYAEFNHFFGSLKQVPQVSSSALTKPLAITDEGTQKKVVFEVRCELI